MNESVTKMHPYDFAATLGELDGGVFIQKISYAMHQTAAAVIGHGKAGKVTLEFSFKQIGTSSQTNCAHKLKFEKPIARGRTMEEEASETPLWVSKKGLTIMPDTQEHFDFDQADKA